MKLGASDVTKAVAAEVTKVGMMTVLSHSGVAFAVGVGVVEVIKAVWPNRTFAQEHDKLRARMERCLLAKGLRDTLPKDDACYLLTHFGGLPDFVKHGEDPTQMAEALLQRRPKYHVRHPRETEAILEAFFESYAEMPDTLHKLARAFRLEVRAWQQNVDATLLRLEQAERPEGVTAEQLKAVLLEVLDGNDFYDPRDDLARRQRRRTRHGASPRQLLDARNEVVPYWTPNGDTRFADFTAWLTADEPFSVRVIEGAGGLGKTRFMLEAWTRAQADGWKGGFLARDLSTHSDRSVDFGAFQERMERRATQAEAPPLLAIVDYAEDRPLVTARLLDAWWNDDALRPRRVVLLTRSVAVLRQALNRREHTDEALRDILTLIPKPTTAPEPDALLDVQGDELRLPPGQRRAFFVHIQKALAEALEADVPDLYLDDAFFDDQPHFGLPLYLIAAALQSFSGHPATDKADLLTALVDRETAHLARCLDDLGRNLPGSKHPALRGVLALATLAMAARSDQATLAQAPTLEALMDESGLSAAVPTVHHADLADLLRDLYPPPPEVPHSVDAVRPDALGEALVEAALRKTPRLLTSAFAPTRDAAAYASAATVLYRAGYTLYPTEASAWLGGLLRGNKFSNEPEEDRTMLDRRDVRAALFDIIPTETGAFGTLMGDCAKPEVEAVRAGGTVPNGEDAVSYLNSLSLRLAHAGDNAAALSATEEIVNIQRVRYADDPEAHGGDLAGYLSNLGLRYADEGRYSDALEVTEEARDIYQALYASNRDRYGSDLAMSLNNLGSRYSELGRYGDALLATEEAVTLRRSLYASNRDRYGSDLAMSLNNLSVHYSNAGRYGDALLATEEAVKLYRALSASNRDRYGSDLAMSLNNLGAHYSEVGRYGDALLATEEAVKLYRALSASNRDRYGSDLAAALNNLGVRYSNAGRYGDALLATEEARDLYRALSASNAARYGSDLANSVGLYAHLLVMVDRGAEAVPIAEEGLRLLTPHMQQRPHALARQLQRTLQTYAQACQQSETP
ncbi:MAG: tetratricopeptide repeat protein, partial [Bacteroidota bacterium]